MQNQKKPINWLVILLGIILIGLSIWSIRIAIHSTQTSTNENQESLERLSSGLGAEDGQNTTQIMVVGGEDDNPPYSYLEEGQALGLDNDLMREIALNLGMQIEYNLTSLDEAKQNLQDGKIDVINGLVESDQVNQNFLFGTPYAIMAYDLFVKRDSGIRSISDIEEGTIVVIQEDGMEQYLKDMGYSGQIITSKDSIQALSWVASNQYDAALIGKIQGYYLINSNHFINLEGVGENFIEGEYSFAVSTENRHLLLQMNQALIMLESSGVYEELTSKWLTTYQQSSFIDKNEYIIYGLVILLTSALIIILWAWSLRRQVKRKTAELRASEKKYRLLIKSATEGVAIVEDKKIIYLNPQGALIFEITESASESKPYMLDFIHPLDQELVLIKYQQLLDGLLMDALLSFRIITVSGTMKWIRVNSVKIDWEGKPALLTFFSDTTEERTLTETIRSSEERYRLIFDQSPVGMFYYNTQLRITNVNDRFNEIMHKNRGELLDFDLNTVSDSRVIDVLKNVMNKESGYYEGWINPLLSDGQPDLFVKLRTTPLFSDKFEYQGGIAIVEDITNQVMSEHKIQNLEDNLSKFFFTSPDAISISTLQDGVFVDCNRGFTELTGYTREEVIGKTGTELNIWVNSEDRDQLVENLLIKGEYKNLEAQFRTKFNQIYHGLMSASIIEIDSQSCLLAITRDIDEIKKSDELIRNSEMRYKSIFESVPVSIWEQDLLDVYDMLEDLRNNGVTDLMDYLETHPDFVEKAIKSVKNLDVNNVSVNLYKAKTKEQLNFSLDKIFNQDSIKNFKQELLAIWNHDTYFNGDSVNVTLEGEEIPINLVMRIPETREGFQHILVSIMDITQRKRTEQALFESEARFRRLVEQVNVVVYLDFAEIPSRPKYVSPQIESLIGYTQEEWLADPELMMKIIHPDDLPGLEEVDIDTDKTGEPFVMEYRAFTKDGRMIWVHDEAVLAYDGDGNRDNWHGVMYDITARKMAEDALRESENRYRTYLIRFLFRSKKKIFQ